MRKRFASIAFSAIFAATVIAGPASAAVLSGKNAPASTTVVQQPKAHGGGHMHW